MLPGLLALDPRAWLSAATIVLIATPMVALAATSIDYRRVERRSSYLAILLIAILVLSIMIAIRV